MVTNDFLPFCPTDTGTNLLSEADYLAAADRTSGNKPGIASSKLNNKALRQSAYIVSQVAQLVSDRTGTDLLDDATPAKLLAQLNAALTPILPNLTKLTSGSGTWQKTYVFFIASGSATVGATYTHNAVTYTIAATVASAVQVRATGSAAPLASGTLTKSGGTGDSTLTFYAVRSAAYIRVEMAGGGGGGEGSANSGGDTAGTAGTGGNTTFGTTLLVANGGTGATGPSGVQGSGGTASLGTGPVGIAYAGAKGTGANLAIAATFQAGAAGGPTPFGGAGTANTGSGGFGTASPSGGYPGAGGGAGGYVNARIDAPSATYAYAVGAAGTAGPAGTGGSNGQAGGSGIILVTEYYQ